jgi:O-antigen biosynthesis protein
MLPKNRYKDSIGVRMKPYFIYTPPYGNKSAGTIVLHRLAQRIQALLNGNVYISTPFQEPGTNRIPLIQDVRWNRKDSIAVYPEIVNGNPFKCGHIVRWILYFLGFFKGPTSYAEPDMLFIYDKLYDCGLNLSEGRILHIPSVNENDFAIFKNINLERTDYYYYRGKGKQPPDPDISGVPQIGIPQRHEGRSNQIKLANKLNKAILLYTYDHCTILSKIANLCGCPVIYMPGDLFKSQAELEKEEVFLLGGIAYGIENAQITISSLSSEQIYESFINENKYANEVVIPNFIELTQRNFI